MRARRPKNLQQSYELYGHWVEDDPMSWRGTWHGYGSRTYDRVHVDLGCGKGGYAVALAAHRPDMLVIGIDSDDICIARCAELAASENVSNCIFLLADATVLPLLFDEGEVGSLTINFPTPLPRKKHAEGRLVHANTLLLCRQVIDGGGEIRFKTDSQPLFDFSLSQFPLAGFDIVEIDRTYDSASHDDVETLYEKRAKELGADICYLAARPCGVPVYAENVSPMSLVDYLPDDLDSMAYVPFGMEDTVFNMRNRRAREQRHQARENS